MVKIELPKQFHRRRKAEDSFEEYVTLKFTNAEAAQELQGLLLAKLRSYAQLQQYIQEHEQKQIRRSRNLRRRRDNLPT